MNLIHLINSLMASFFYYSHWLSSPFVQVFLTSLSADDFFLYQCGLLKKKALAVLWYTRVNFKSMVFNPDVVLTF